MNTNLYIHAEKNFNMHIAIAGNIGSGKTTLTRLLAKHFNWKPHFEDVENNPYLHSFYQDMQRWSFNLQVYFLNSRFRQVVEIRKSGKNIVQDRTIYEDAYIFAPNLHSMNLMSTRDFENYSSLFELMNSFIPTILNLVTPKKRDQSTILKLIFFLFFAVLVILGGGFGLWPF